MGTALNHLAGRLDRRVREASLLAPDAFAGVDDAGSLGLSRLVDVIAALGACGGGSAEIGIHPGERGDLDLDRYQWGYRWGDELDALVSPLARDAVMRAGFTLGSFAALETVSW